MTLLLVKNAVAMRRGEGSDTAPGVTHPIIKEKSGKLGEYEAGTQLE